MAMFDNYPSPSDYIPNNSVEVLVGPDIPPETLPRTEYNVEGDIIGISWKYGDTPIVQYKVDDYILDKIDGSVIKIDILDHNRISVYSTSVVGEETINFPVGEELSATMIKGNYYFTVAVVYYENETKNTYVSRELLIVVK